MTDILTLRLDPAAQVRFDRMRQLHYPEHLNQIAAHLTLFHQLPDSAETLAKVEAACRVERFPMTVIGLRSLGRGVAYTLESGELLALHKGLAAAFASDLIAQDRQRFQPHIVVQNKVAPDAARQLLATLRAGFEPFAVEAIGLDVWRYLGGSWEHARTVLFL